MKTNKIPAFLIGFFLICYALRIMDSLFIRTDQGFIGELFTHKLLGIVLLAIALSYLRMKWSDIGFKWKQLPWGILTGLAIGGTAYITAYAVEIVIAAIQGKSPSLQFYVTNYDMLGNSALGNGVLFIIICIIGNIINVIMENGVFTGFMITVGKKRHSFFIANGFYSSFMFGLWHSVMPLRNFVDGNMALLTALMAALMLFFTSYIFSIQTGIQYEQSSSVWDAMAVHFINNASANMFHVVFQDGTESAPVMRITIAGVIMFTIVLIRYFSWKKQMKNRV
jgi:hypothetical protein